MQMHPARGVMLADVNRGDHCLGQGRWCRCSVDIGSCMLYQIVDHNRLCCDKRPRYAGGLTQCCHIDETRRLHSKMTQYALPLLAEHTESMCVIQHQPRVVAFA